MFSTINELKMLVTYDKRNWFENEGSGKRWFKKRLVIGSE